jgi:hypothetical protein
MDFHDVGDADKACYRHDVAQKIEAEPLVEKLSLS